MHKKKPEATISLLPALGKSTRDSLFKHGSLHPGVVESSLEPCFWHRSLCKPWVSWEGWVL